jgi:hypothetical protein
MHQPGKARQFYSLTLMRQLTYKKEKDDESA